MYYEASAVKAALTGPVPSVSTPFLKDGTIDWKSLQKMIHFWLDNGAKTLLITPGDSLLTTLSPQEIGDVCSFTVRETAKRAMVIASGGQWWLGQTLEFIRACKEDGADVVIPYPADWAQSADAALLAEFYQAAGEIMPIMILTNLGTRGVPMNTFERLFEGPAEGVVCVKDDAPAPYGKRLASWLGGRLGFLSGGRAETHLEIAPYGVDGYLSVFMRTFPSVAHAYWEAYTTGNLTECTRLIDSYEVPFFQCAARLGLNFDAAIHGMLELNGLCSRWRRAPYQSADDRQISGLQTFLREKKLL